MSEDGQDREGHCKTEVIRKDEEEDGQCGIRRPVKKADPRQPSEEERKEPQCSIQNKYPTTGWLGTKISTFKKKTNNF